jgi:hypothetical protein
MAMTLRPRPEHIAALNYLADEQEVSKNEAALRAIIETAERHGRTHMISEVTDRVILEDRSLLDRLAQ